VDLARTFADDTLSPAHLSFWRRGLQSRAGARDVDDWLIEQANLRGFHGAWVMPSGCTRDADLSLEEIVVGLCAPQATADGRVFKLVVRIAQSGKIDPARLARLARMERADGVLHWLFRGVPEVERTAAFLRVAAAFAAPPRGYRPPRYRYDFGRLVRRPGQRRP
jgi:hypothetical protein